jgi:two-component system, OmpR family, phosphate regulon response regulator PhoB
MAPTDTATILVVDDDEDIRTLLSRSLRADGFAVTAVGDGDAARDALRSGGHDLVVLDVVLPAEDGLDLLAELRKTSDVPVIMLTGRGDEQDRILGLKLGADDYLVKPFSPGELAARITSVLRRSRPSSSTAAPGLDFGDLCIDPITREVTARGEVVALTAKEFDLLTFLATAPRQVFSREQLLTQVWGSSSDWQDPATVTEHVRRVRRKIEADPDQPRWITTVRGVGYRFEP